MNVNAKVNLSLNITGGTSGGYHCLDTVMVSVNIADTIVVSKRKDRDITVKMLDSNGNVIQIENKYNSAYKAAYALINGFNLGGVDIVITKRIPFAAGMGGSSADAAGVIAAISKIFNVDVKSSSAYIIAFKSGSDVPYMLDGGCAHVTGRGEKVEKIAFDGALHMVVAKGKSGCSTKASYDKFDMINNWKRGNSAAMIKALKNSDSDAVAENLINDLQTPSVLICPEIQTTLNILQSTNPLGCIMSGSGSACFAVYRTAALAETAEISIKDKLDFVSACRTVPSSIVINEG